MSIIQGNSKVSAGGYEIDQSIRFNDDDSAYLTSGTLGTATNSYIWTFSWWGKRGVLGTYCTLVSTNTSANDAGRFTMRFDQTTNVLLIGGYATNWRITSRVFRDPSAWLHIVVKVDTTQATAADRLRLYINGVEETAFTTNNNPTQNTTIGMNTAGQHQIGRDLNGGGFLYDGYMAEINFIDGQALAPTSFGETNNDGVWVPKAYAGTYGTNGFYITGEDSADLGADYSGNGNDFTSSGLTASDQMPDSPTNNYGTLNPLTGVNSGSSVVTEANGNLEATQTANYVGTFGTVAANSGKYYFEYSYAADGDYSDGRLLGGVVCVETADHGHFRIDGSSFYYPDKTTEGNYMVFHRSGNGQQSNTGTSTSAYNTNLSSSSATGGPESGPDIYMVAMDLDNDNLYWGKNGTWYGASSTSGSDYTDATPIAILSAHQGKYFAPAFYWSGAASGTTTVLNCGQDATFGGRYSSPAGDFYYTPPTGFSALSTANLPTPAIADGSKYFQTTTYTGAGYPTEVNQSGNSTFQPDFVWVKRRNGATTHDLFDAVRGVSSQLYSNLTNAEGTVSNAISFDADGFTAAADPITGDTGSSGNTFVGWQWLAANGTASNSDGSITSTVSANTTAGFSILTYAGSGGTGTVGHGLGQAPNFLIVKSRDTANAWYTGSDFYTTWEYYQTLNSTAAQSAGSTVWNSTAPTSSVFSVGASINTSAEDYVAYCFHEVEGFSKFGKYTGNGSADGPFVWCDFRPAYVLIKVSSTSGSWFVYDTARDTYNASKLQLFPNLTSAEDTSSTYDIDIVSNGFKIRSSNGNINTSSGTHIFMAFAEHPFGGDGVAPVPAR